MNLNKVLVLTLVVLVVLSLLVDVEAKKKRKRKDKRSKKSKRRSRKGSRNDQIINGGPMDPAVINFHRAAVRLKVGPGHCGATWVTQDCIVTSTDCVDSTTTATITAHFYDVDPSNSPDHSCEHQRGVQQIVDVSTNPDNCEFTILKLNGNAPTGCTAPPMDCAGTTWPADPKTWVKPTRVLGWGLIDPVSPPLPNVLHYADIKSREFVNNRCKNENGLTNADKPCHICTRAQQSSNDYTGPCHGDGGTPLLNLARTTVGMNNAVPQNCHVASTTDAFSAYMKITKMCPDIMAVCGMQTTEPPTTVEPSTEPPPTSPEMPTTVVTEEPTTQPPWENGLCDSQCPDTPMMCPSQCGDKPPGSSPAAASASRGDFIIGGTQTDQWEWPWQAGLYRWNGLYFGFVCGGTLIHKEWVLTAAHCIPAGPINLGHWLIRLGDHDRCIGFDIPHESSHSAVQIIRHPNWVSGNNDFEYDIALIKISPAVVPFTPQKMPACLPNIDHVSAFNWFWVTGWGRTDPYTYNSLSCVLKEVSLPWQADPHPLCQTFPGMFCLGPNPNFPNVNEHICNGDSGGPVVFKDPSCGKWVVVGIVSYVKDFGDPNDVNNPIQCGQSFYAGGFTDVYHYLCWIRSHIP